MEGEFEVADHIPPSVHGAKINDALLSGSLSTLLSSALLVHIEVFSNKVSATAFARSIAAPDPIPTITPHPDPPPSFNPARFANDTASVTLDNVGNAELI
jgi:hypothetical protein